MVNEIINYFLDENFITIITRLLIALLLSGMIGFEREMNNQFAGFRTHILVGVGACLMMLLSLFGFLPFFDQYENIRFDPARIPSYVISGIGFLGAGTIMVYGGTIRGLTTAASIWTVAGIGLVVGTGMYGAAVLATIIILISLRFLNNFEKILPRNRISYFLEMEVFIDYPINEIIAVIEKSNATIKNIDIDKTNKKGKTITIQVEKKKGLDKVAIIEELSNLEAVMHVSELKR